ncbi:MAG TPA: hypothetical protein DCQ98_18665 [Planctomycetaceae bacterium]|nr:hypothetical protein [Planctomycetaceae bacterium]HRF02641.1 DUF4956 domain-containing protein [Pirellulaceae bacterium]
MSQIQEAWEQLQKGVSLEGNPDVLLLAVNLLIGGFLSLYVRWLFRRFGTSPSDADSIGRVFPILTLVTTGVIAVVKSSLALSLGLVGALSIVRFRSAIKEPEELVYLFLCIAVGLALGAGQPLLAIALLAVSTLFIVGMSLTGKNKRRQNLMLTITADARQAFADGTQGVLKRVEEVTGSYTLQRLDVEEGRAQIRLVLPDATSKQATDWITRLQQNLPGCDLSVVNVAK